MNPFTRIHSRIEDIILDSIIFLFLCSCSLTPAQTKEAEQAALTAAQVACIMLSELSESQEVVTACKVEQSLTPVVRELVGTRDAAKKMGVKYHPPVLDGGTDAGNQ